MRRSLAAERSGSSAPPEASAIAARDASAVANATGSRRRGARSMIVSRVAGTFAIHTVRCDDVAGLHSARDADDADSSPRAGRRRRGGTGFPSDARTTRKQISAAMACGPGRVRLPQRAQRIQPTVNAVQRRRGANHIDDATPSSTGTSGGARSLRKLQSTTSRCHEMDRDRRDERPRRTPPGCHEIGDALPFALQRHPERPKERSWRQCDRRL